MTLKVSVVIYAIPELPYMRDLLKAFLDQTLRNDEWELLIAHDGGRSILSAIDELRVLNEQIVVRSFHSIDDLRVPLSDNLVSLVRRYECVRVAASTHAFGQAILFASNGIRIGRDVIQQAYERCSRNRLSIISSVTPERRQDDGWLAMDMRLWRKTPDMIGMWAGGHRERQSSEREIFNDHRNRYRFAAQFCKGGKVIDLGCGTGFGAEELKDVGRYIGIDPDEESIAWAKEHYGGPAITFRADRITGSTLPSESFDCVTCFEVLEHVPLEDKAQILTHAMRLLKPGGVFICSTPQKGSTPGTPWDRFMVDKVEFAALMDSVGYTSSWEWHRQLEYGGGPDEILVKQGEPNQYHQIMVAVVAKNKVENA